MYSQIGDPFKVSNMIVPRGGPKIVPVRLDFQGTDEIIVDGNQVVTQGKIEYIQTIYIDNSNNTSPLSIECDITGQRITIPANAQGNFNLFMPNNPRFIVTTAGNFVIEMFFCNFPLMPSVWSTVAAGGSVAISGGTLDAVTAITDPVQTIQPIGGAYTDQSITNLTGASEELMPANANRRFLLISNEGATAIAVNMIGGAAALNTAGSITIAAGGSITLDTYPPTGAINIIGTAGADVTAYEG